MSRTLYVQDQAEGILCKFWKKWEVCPRGDECRYRHGKGARLEHLPGECLNFHLAGMCPQGEVCQMGHGKDLAQDQHGNIHRTELCWKGKCRKGSHCKYAHGQQELTRKGTGICFEFLVGRCHRGWDCNLAHNVPPQAPNPAKRPRSG
jgi:hypothetical protein